MRLTLGCVPLALSLCSLASTTESTTGTCAANDETCSDPSSNDPINSLKAAVVGVDNVIVTDSDTTATVTEDSETESTVSENEKGGINKKGDTETKTESSKPKKRGKAISRTIPKYEPSCKFYLAPSSIPNAGFGIYTSQSIPANTPITNVPDAPSIVVTDTEVHNDGKSPAWNHHDYFWDGAGFSEFEASSVEESVVTFGSLCNYHTYLYNIKPFAAEYDDSITPRAEGSPGIGAYSYHPGFHFFSTRDISAGEEIFANYGPDWLEQRSFGGSIPREEDFDVAGDIIKKTMQGLSETDEINDPILKTVRNIVKGFDKRVSVLLPETVDSLEEITSKIDITKDDSSSSEKDVSEKIAKKIADDSIIYRTLDWITSEGICLDNLVPQISTLPHAGRGAFAQRFIAKGEIIVPAPLLHMMDYKSLDIFSLVLDEDTNKVIKSKEEGDEEAVTSQLITNYCFSHAETSMLLCPQSNGILMNHCSDRKSYGGDCEKYNQNEDLSQRGPNAEIRWAKEWDPDTKSWLKMSMSEIRRKVKQSQRGVSLDYIATRDIHPGEEVFIDYGEEWENAWEDHKDSYTPHETDDYIPIKELTDETKIFHTPEELELEPYPDNAQLACVYWAEEGEIIENGEEEEEYEYTEDEWVSDGREFTEDSDDFKEFGFHWPCQVLERNEQMNETTYTVELFAKDGDTIWMQNDHSRILEDYPEESIIFVPESYESDQHLLGTFRSYMSIPDSIFPHNWRDLEE